MLAFVRYCHLLTYYMYKERRNWKKLGIIFECDCVAVIFTWMCLQGVNYDTLVALPRVHKIIKSLVHSTHTHTMSFMIMH